MTIVAVLGSENSECREQLQYLKHEKPSTVLGAILCYEPGNEDADVCKNASYDGAMFCNTDTSVCVTGKRTTSDTIRELNAIL